MAKNQRYELSPLKDVGTGKQELSLGFQDPEHFAKNIHRVENMLYYVKTDNSIKILGREAEFIFVEVQLANSGASFSSHFQGGGGNVDTEDLLV